MIRRLRRKLAQQQEVACQNAEQIEELEEYIKIQETYFAEQIVTKDMLLTELKEKHSREQEEWTFAKTTLEQRSSNVEVVVEQRRLDMLVVQAMLMQAEGETKAQVTNLQQRKCSIMFELSCNLERILEFFTRELPQAFLCGPEMNLIRLCELMMFVLNHNTSTAETNFYERQAGRLIFNQTFKK